MTPILIMVVGVASAAVAIVMLFVLLLLVSGLDDSFGRYSVVRVATGQSLARTMSLWVAWELANAYAGRWGNQFRVWDRWRREWRDSTMETP